MTSREQVAERMVPSTNSNAHDRTDEHDRADSADQNDSPDQADTADRNESPDQADSTERTDDGRSEIARLSASGDLLDVARQMRQMGVESLLFARPDGRITRVVTDRQIAHLAGTVSASPATWLAPVAVAPSGSGAGQRVSVPGIQRRVLPEQAVSVDDDLLEGDPTGAGVRRG